MVVSRREILKQILGSRLCWMTASVIFFTSMLVQCSLIDPYYIFHNDTLLSYGQSLLLIAGISAVVMLICMMFFVIVIMYPLFKLREHLWAASDEALNPEEFVINTSRNDEIGSILREFDNMLFRLEKGILSLRLKERALDETSRNLKQMTLSRKKLIDEANTKLKEEYTKSHQAEEKIERISRLTEEDTSPIMRVNEKGVLLYVNSASRILLEAWHITVGRCLPKAWNELALKAFQKGKACAAELPHEGQLFLAHFVPVSEQGYVNIYCTDITQFKAEQQTEKVEEPPLVEELRQAINRNQLVLHYQPQINIRSGKVFGFEALLRWQHPEKGLLPPAEFIPLAEEYGIIAALGCWVLKRACLDAKEWESLGKTKLYVAVNISADQFVNEDIVKDVKHALKESHLEPGLLELQITESSSLLSDHKMALSIMNDLDATGVQLSMDDFGTGHASLIYLKQFPVHRLKIAAEFVADIHQDEYSASIVTALIKLGHSLGLKVIAEHVEKEEQLTYLKSHGCDDAQGFLICPPLPTADIAQFVEACYEEGEV